MPEQCGFSIVDDELTYVPQSAGVILTQNNCPDKNSSRIHFYDAYGVPEGAKTINLL